MKLLLDFGNTRVKAAVSSDCGLKQIYSGPVVLGGLEHAVCGMEIDGGMWCSVRNVPDDVMAWMLSLGLTGLDWTTPVPICNAYRTPRTLGMDRLAAAVGAWSMQKGHDILVIDAGTAVTCDFVSADSRFLGGTIAPGVELRLKALHEHTGALPLVGRQGDMPVFGYDTETSIRSGVVNGIRREILGTIQEMCQMYPSLLVFLTGGDANCFDMTGKSNIFAVDNLVLRGLDAIGKYNEVENE